jgi:hypothetical protein
MPYKSIDSKNLGFIEQKNVFSNSTDRFKKLIIDLIFVVKFFSVDLFRGVPYRLILILNKGELFH